MFWQSPDTCMIHGQRRVSGYWAGGGHTTYRAFTGNAGKKETQEQKRKHRKQKRRVSGYWAGRGHTTYRAFTGNKIRSRDKTLFGSKEM